MSDSIINETSMQPASVDIWDKKYRLKSKDGQSIDKTISDTYKRVARALADVEETTEKQDYWYDNFLWAMNNGAIPAGRIISNAGAEEYKPSTSVINCTLSDTVPDSIDGIMKKCHEAALTLHSGAGIGYCFSTLRPKGAIVGGVGANTSGPLLFMDIFNSMCNTISSAGGRRGAQMGTFDVRHPDIVEFIKAKKEDGRLRQFNLSVLIIDEFMRAVENDEDHHLIFPVLPAERKKYGILEDATLPTDRIDGIRLAPDLVYAQWTRHEGDGYISNNHGLVLCRIYDTIKARYLWDLIMESTYDYAEPGFILIDRVNEMNNNWWCESIISTNPCLAEGTLVKTPEGLVPIETLKAGDIIDTISGQGAIESVEIHESVPVFDVALSNGVSVTATAAHIFHSRDKDEWRTNVRLDDLNIGDLVRVVDDEGTEVNDISVVSITPAGNARVYDLYEPVTDTWITEGGIVSRGCGEQPLPPYGSCLLGSVNLTKFVRNPFTDTAVFDWKSYIEVVEIFTRMLDNVVEINGLALEQQRQEIMNKRRHGMGYLGLGSALTMLGIKYGLPESLEFTEEVTRAMALAGWKVALDLAKEKGAAPIMEQEFTVSEEMLEKRPEMRKYGYQVGGAVKGKVLHARYSRYMQRIAAEDPELIAELAESGARFTHHTSIAPTGTISLSLANNSSNGIEPSFAHHYSRNVIREGKKSKEKVDVFSFELLAYRELINADAMPGDLPECFITADDVTPKQHVDVQSAAQKWIDSSISKTANVPTDYPYEDFKDIYRYAYDKDLKGCATFRFNPEVFQGVLVKDSDLENTHYCFVLDDGKEIVVKGNEEIEYDGELHSAANLHDAIKEGYYGKL